MELQGFTIGTVGEGVSESHGASASAVARVVELRAEGLASTAVVQGVAADDLFARGRGSPAACRKLLDCAKPEEPERLTRIERLTAKMLRGLEHISCSRPDV
jgi:hypothetical protein